MLNVLPQVQEFKAQNYRGIIVSVSGGADSCALLHLLATADLPLPLAVLHVNYGLRSAESDADAEHVAALAEKFNLSLHLHSVDSGELAKGNMQEQARNIRTRKLQAFAQANNYIVAIAHQRDDLAENILYRLVQGKGAGQLAGMKVFNPPFWRPFLALSRQDILAYCQAQGVIYRNDSSNTNVKYARNRIRMHVLPQLGKINSQATENISSVGNDMQELYEQTQVELSALYRHELAAQRISAETIKRLPSSKAKLLLHLFLGKQHSTRKLILSVYRQVLDDRKFVICVNAQRLLNFSAGELFFSTRPPATKASRQQQCRRALHYEQFHAALEPHASAETKDGMILLAYNDSANGAKGSSIYGLSRPSAKQKLRWQGQRYAFKELMRVKGIDFTGSLRWYLRSCQGQQKPEVIHIQDTNA